MSNRVTLDGLVEMPREEAAKLPATQLAMLQDDLKEEQTRLKKIKAAFDAVMDQRYGERAMAVRKAQGQQAGTVRLDEEDDLVCVAELPKKPVWDQGELKIAMETIRGWGSDPNEYARAEFKVSESAFNAWPSEIRKVFEPARTLTLGKPNYTLVKKEAA